MHKVDARIGNHAANRFALYMNVFPHTLSLPNVGTWDTVLVDHPLVAQDEASFQQAIRHFIAMHATDKVCHELLDYICSVAKPREMEAQMYYSCLRKINHIHSTACEIFSHATKRMLPEDKRDEAAPSESKTWPLAK
jgi:hypothetical protein